MAERAKSKPRAAKGKIKGKAIATLPKKSKGAKGKPGVGHNSGLHAVSDEVIGRHLDTLKAKKKALQKIVDGYKDDLDQARGVYRSARKLAKKEGVNLKAFDIMADLESDDMGHVQVNYADVACYQKITDSPLLQLEMFSSMLAPEPAVDVALQGQQAGKEGVNRDANPHKPGGDDFQVWDENWMLGQGQIVAKMSKGDKAALN
jgi:hypothetical protein